MNRDDFASCPRCRSGLDAHGTRLGCATCHGELVPDADLLEQLRTKQLSSLLDNRRRWFVAEGPAFQSIDGKLPLEQPRERALRDEVELVCPRCMTTMTKHALCGQIVDRCSAHGIWLDGDGELTKLLRKGGGRTAWFS